MMHLLVYCVERDDSVRQNVASTSYCARGDNFASLKFVVSGEIIQKDKCRIYYEYKMTYVLVYCIRGDNLARRNDKSTNLLCLGR